MNSVPPLEARPPPDADLGGRVVLQQQVTHILVVSDSPAPHREANRRRETELKGLKVGFSITAPMAVADGASRSSATKGP